MADWSGAVIAIVSVVAGGAFEHLRAAAATSRERRVTEAGLRRARLEELIIELERLRSYVTLTSIDLLRFLVDHQVPKPRDVGSTSKIPMLVRIYSPSLEPELDRLEEARRQFNNALGDFIKERSTPSTKTTAELVAATAAVEKAVKEFQVEAAKIASGTLVP